MQRLASNDKKTTIQLEQNNRLPISEGQHAKTMVRRKKQPNLELKKALRQARKNYRPALFPGNVILKKVEDSPYKWRAIDRRLPWQSVTSGTFTEMWIPGNHLTMLQEPLVRNLGEQLSEQLRNARHSIIVPDLGTGSGARYQGVAS